MSDPTLERYAAAVGATGPVAVQGARTRWDIGGALDASARLVDAPTGIVAYEPAEMTLRVRAGTPVAEIEAALFEQNQRTSLPRRGGTVGGALAVGEGPLATLGLGRMRSALLEVTYVSAEGRLVRGGGATVKNVSGFDIPRLMVGSLGTLGLFGEVLLRTNPAPRFTRRLVSTDASPRAVLDSVLTAGMILWDGTSTWVDLEGHEPDVDAHHRALNQVGTFAETDTLPPLPPHRWSLSLSETYALSDEDSERGPGTFVASIGVGTVFAENPQPSRPQDPGVKLVADRMKQQFDPTGRLNPGRNPHTR